MHPPDGNDATSRRHRSAVRSWVAWLSLLAAPLCAGTSWLVRDGGSAGAMPTTLTAARATTVASSVDRGVVDIVATLEYGRATAAGTGIVVTPDGAVITNNHVIEGATSITVTEVQDGASYPATVAGYDVADDIAVLQMSGASGLATASLSTAPVRDGEAVVAIGNAYGRGGTPSVSTGVVIGHNLAVTVGDDTRSEHLNGMIEAGAPIAAGASGGPLVDAKGDVLAIDTAVSASGRESFAIPVGTAVAVADAVRHGAGSSRVHVGGTATLGVEVEARGYGVTVRDVRSGSPADLAGLSIGDVIVAIDGRTVTSPSQFRSLVDARRPGDLTTVEWTDASRQPYVATFTLPRGPAG